MTDLSAPSHIALVVGGFILYICLKPPIHRMGLKTVKKMAAATNGIQAKPHFRCMHQDVPKKRRGFARAQSLSWLLGNPLQMTPIHMGIYEKCFQEKKMHLMEMDCKWIAILLV